MYTHFDISEAVTEYFKEVLFQKYIMDNYCSTGLIYSNGDGYLEVAILGFEEHGTINDNFISKSGNEDTIVQQYQRIRNSSPHEHQFTAVNCLHPGDEMRT